MSDKVEISVECLHALMAVAGGLPRATYKLLVSPYGKEGPLRVLYRIRTTTLERAKEKILKRHPNAIFGWTGTRRVG